MRSIQPLVKLAVLRHAVVTSYLWTRQQNAACSMCTGPEGPLSNVSVVIFLEALEESHGSTASAFLQAWWRRTFPREIERTSDVSASAFIAGLKDADGGAAGAFLQAWWATKVPDPDGWWTQGVLDSGSPFWWRDSSAQGLEVRLKDPSESAGSTSGVDVADADMDHEWTQGVLKCGSPFWWRESDTEPDGIEISLTDPGTE